MKIRLEENKDISNLLTLHTSTIARYYTEVKTVEDFQEAAKKANELKVPFLVLGGGSNIVFSKMRINALVVKNLYLKKEIIAETETEIKVLVSSGYPTNKLVFEAISAGWEGMEYHKGLPGTIGGAIYMNSKWTKPQRYIGDYLIKAVLMDCYGNLKKVDYDYFNFKYDFSILQQTKETIIDLVFKFKKVEPRILAERAKQAADYRSKTQPKGVATCGCFFRNISVVDQKRLNLPTRSVGYILDNLNLKGLTVGDFTVSNVHANFIINKANKKGRISDLKKLLGIIKKRVKDKYKIKLVEEVVIV